MSTLISPRVEVVEEFHDDVRYIFPRRNIGSLRWMGLIPMLFGLAFSGFALVWMTAAAGMAVQAGPFGWLFVLFGMPFLLAGAIPFFVGLCVLCGRSEIHLKRGRLRAIERAGPFWWSRSRRADELVKLVVMSTPEKTQAPRQAATVHLALKNLAAIKSEYQKAKPMMLAFGYAEDLLQPVAHDLAERCAVDCSFAEATKRPVVSVQKLNSLGGTDNAITPLYEAPAGTDIRCERHADGVTIEVPPAGLWKGSKGLFSFGLFWCGFMAVFSSIMIFSGDVDEIFPWLFVALFWAVGIGLLLGGINMGRRKAALAVVGGTLMVIRVGLFGAKRGEWPQEYITDVRVGPSGMEVNSRPVMELQIHSAEGKKFGLLSSRTDEELRWITGEIRLALGLDDGVEAVVPESEVPG